MSLGLQAPSSYILSQMDTQLMKKAYFFKIQIMIDTKIITNIKKNTPFDIIFVAIV